MITFAERQWAADTASIALVPRTDSASPVRAVCLIHDFSREVASVRSPRKANGNGSGNHHDEGAATTALLRLGRYLTRAESSADLHSVHLTGGREADAFYRDRWSHDKVVPSTHGVNCTGSCRWNVYVSDGIITWESQDPDYPSVGPDKPEYEPRGCPRGASFSWYSYSPTRVRFPYARGVLVEMYREALKQHGDPVVAWASVMDDPMKRLSYQRARGRADWSGSAGTKRRKSRPPRMCTPFRATGRTGSPAFRRFRRCPWSRTRSGRGSWR